MATFNEVFSQRLGRNLPRQTSMPQDSLAARTENDKRFQILQRILDEDRRRKSQASNPATSVPGMNADNEQVITDNAGFSLKNSLLSIGQGALDVASRGLDIISRPAYATFEALQSGAESLENSGFDISLSKSTLNPGGVVSQLGNALVNDPMALGEAVVEGVKGAGRGIAGKDKTGFGEVIETTDPDMNIHYKRLYGFTGELGLDPLNYIGVGLIGKGAKGARGLDEVKDVYKGIAREAADSKGFSPLLNKRVMQSAGVGADGGKISRNLPLSKTYLDDVVDKAFDDTVVELNKGLAGGRILGGELLPGTVSTKVGESMRNLFYRDFDDGFDQFMRHVTGEEVLSQRQLKQLFGTKLKNFESYILKTHAKDASKRYGSVQEMLFQRTLKSASPANTEKIMRDAAAAFKAELDDVILDIQGDIFKKLEGQLYNAPAIKFGGKEIASLDRVGRAYSKFRANKLSGPGLKGLSYGKTFPGRTALMNQRLRSQGIRKYEAFHREVKEVAQQLTKDERKEVHRAILQGRDFLDPRLQQAKEFVQEKYAQMWNEEISSGVHKLDAEDPFKNFASNYVYLYHRKNKGRILKDLRDSMKRSVVDNRSLPSDAIDLAKQKGLAPVEDAFEALLLRQIKSNRDLSRAWFMRDLLDHYGIKGSRLSTKGSGARGLVDVDKMTGFPDNIRRSLKEGERWYLPGDIADIYKEYNKILSLGSSEEAAALLKVYDKLTRMFKASATLPYPGFHIRNSLGDIFMSSLDGVQFRDYAILNRLWSKQKAGQRAVLNIAGDNFSYDELTDIFLDNAASGNFMSVDLGIAEGFTKVAPNRMIDAAKRGSEFRENFFRKAHFIKAFKEEYPKALKQTRNKAVAKRNAAEAATYRVNKALFDYGALTQIERQGFRRAIPFYTYSRKVMPTLMEAMLLNPRNLSRVNRWMLDEEARGDSKIFNDMLVPQYAREIGYAQLTDEEEPWILRADFLPTSVLRENFDFSSAQGMGANLLQNLNPMIKMPAELGLGRTAFDNREIQSSADYMGGAAFPFLGPISDFTNKAGLDLSGVPGLGRFRGQSSKEWGEVGLSNRFALGLPFDRIKENQQAAALYTLTADIKRELGSVNDSIKENGLSIYLSQRKEGTSFRVRDDESGQILFESLDAQATADFARKANNAKKRFRTSSP